MKYLKYAGIFLVIFIIDHNLINLISIKGVTPDLILIFLIFISLKESQINSTIFGFCGGLFQDLLTLGILGLFSLTKAISCFITSYFKHVNQKYSISNLAIIFISITMIHELIYQFIFLLGANQKIINSFLYHSVPKALYTMVVALIINLLFSRSIWQSNQHE